MDSSADLLRKRNADPELGGPASKMSKTEKVAEKNKLQSKEDGKETQSANKNDGDEGAQNLSRMISAVNSTRSSGLHNALRVLDRVVSEDLPDLLDELDSARLLAFLDMGTELQQEDAEELVLCIRVCRLPGHLSDQGLTREQRRFPVIRRLKGAWIVNVHKSLRKCNPDAVLLPQELHLFLELVNDRFGDDLDEYDIDVEVEKVLGDIEIINRVNHSAMMTPRDDKSKAMTLMTTLGTVQQSVRQVQDQVEGVATKLKHGR